MHPFNRLGADADNLRPGANVIATLVNGTPTAFASLVWALAMKAA